MPGSVAWHSSLGMSRWFATLHATAMPAAVGGRTARGGSTHACSAVLAASLSMRCSATAVSKGPSTPLRARSASTPGTSLSRRPTMATSAIALFSALRRLASLSISLVATSVPSACCASVHSAASRAVRLLCAASVLSTDTCGPERYACQLLSSTCASEVLAPPLPRGARLRFLGAAEVGAGGASGLRMPSSYSSLSSSASAALLPLVLLASDARAHLNAGFFCVPLRRLISSPP